MASKAHKITVLAIAPSDTKGLYNVQGEDTVDYVVWIGDKPVPSKGEVMVCFPDDDREGQYKFWKIDVPQEGAKKKAWSGGGKGKSDFKERDDYWKKKQQYEEEFRDVEIRFQTYLDKALVLAQFCVANGLPLEINGTGKNVTPFTPASGFEMFQWASDTAQSFISGRDEFLKEDQD